MSNDEIPEFVTSTDVNTIEKEVFICIDIMMRVLAGRPVVVAMNTGFGLFLQLAEQMPKNERNLLSIHLEDVINQINAIDDMKLVNNDFERPQSN